MLQQEQSAAYERAVAADLARQQEAEEARRREEEARQAEARKQKELEDALRKKETDREFKAMRLPQEPPEGTQNVTAIRFRLPSGECLQRRFYLDSDVSNLYDFVDVHGGMEHEFELVSPPPALRVLPRVGKTLRSVELPSRVQISVRELEDEEDFDEEEEEGDWDEADEERTVGHSN